MLKGLKISTGANYNSIPGLVVWADPRSGISTINAPARNGDEIREFQTRGVANILYDRSYNFATAYPPMQNGDFIDFDFDNISDDVQIGAPQPELLNFLHDGSPFGFFEIFGTDWLGTGGQSASFLTAVSASEIGVLLRVNNGTNVTLSWMARNGTADTTINLTGSLSKSVMHPIGIVRNSLDESNNFKYYINGSLSQQQSVTYEIVGDAVRNRFSSANASGRRFVYGTRVIYNWSGYTASEIATFTSQVLALQQLDFATYGSFPSRITP